MDATPNKSREDLIDELKLMKDAYFKIFNEAFDLKHENEKLKKDLAQHNRIWNSQENLINILMEHYNNTIVK
jgi:hypothetical protein